jgi:fatty-acyl-CoA synthase
MVFSTLEASAWPARTAESLRPSTVGSTLFEAAQARPDGTAFVARGAGGGDFRRWSFDRLVEDAEGTARALLGRFEPGERVAVWAPNVAEFFLLQLGAGLAGLTLVPIPLALRQRDLGHLLGQSGATGLFLVPEYRGVAMAEILEEVRPQLPQMREVVNLTDWPGFLASSAGSSALPSVDPRSAAQVQYTSGSTGLPKGALLHHQGITNSARFLGARMGVTGEDVWLNFMPLSYVAGSAIGAMVALAAGATQVLCDFEPAAVLGLIEGERCSALIGGATMYLMLLEQLAASAADCSSLRTMAAGGSTISPALAGRAETALGARMSVIYGLTEVCGIAVSTSIDDPDPERTTTIGTPLAHVEAKVADTADGRVLATGELGELCLRGYQVMHGYLDLPEATAEALDGDGWLHTGDLATMDADGHLRVTGRLKETINRGGRKIAPGEIEAVLHAHPAVGLAAAVGIPDERWGEEIAAFVKLRPGASADEVELADWCRSQLAPFKTPRRWVFVDELPLTSAGKVRKFLLRQQLSG